MIYFINIHHFFDIYSFYKIYPSRLLVKAPSKHLSTTFLSSTEESTYN